MVTSRTAQLRELRLPGRTVRLMTEIAESKGHQQLHAKLAGQLLRALRSAAFVRTVESANRMEGIAVPPGRLSPLIAGYAKPSNQSEHEICGYSRALTMIYGSVPNTSITSSFLQGLHETILESTGEERDMPREESSGIVSHNITAGEMTPAVEAICISYRQALSDREVHPLLAVAALILDFQCLHPFGRGHVRMMVLVALLALVQNGFEVGRYVSLGRWFEQTLDDFSHAVRLSCQDWNAGRHSLVPWLEYFFSVLRSAYQELEQCVEQVKSPRGAKSILVETAIDGFPDSFTLLELEQACPGVSRVVIHRMLRKLQKRGLVERTRRGSYAARYNSLKPRYQYGLGGRSESE